MIKLSGKVIKGAKYGRVLGFPTANLDRREYARKKLKIKFGVWAGRVGYKLQANSYKSYKAGIVIGPIDKLGLPKIEAHLIGYKGNLYGKFLNIYLIRYLRPFREFANVNNLKQQIQKDIGRVRELEN